MRIRYSEEKKMRSLRTMFGEYVTIGDEKNAVKLFSLFLKMRDEDKKEAPKYEELVLDGYKLRIIWSKQTKNYFIEIYMGEKLIASVKTTISKISIGKQAKYFSDHIAAKKDVWNKILTLYPLGVGKNPSTSDTTTMHKPIQKS